jgi:hypothetical protein
MESLCTRDEHVLHRTTVLEVYRKRRFPSPRSESSVKNAGSASSPSRAGIKLACKPSPSQCASFSTPSTRALGLRLVSDYLHIDGLDSLTRMRAPRIYLTHPTSPNAHLGIRGPMHHVRQT